MLSRSLPIFIHLSVLSVGGVLAEQGSNFLAKSFYPKVNYEVYGDGVAVPTSKTQRDIDFKDVAVSFIGSKLGIQDSEVVYRSGFSSDIVDHAYFNQAHNNVTFTNAVANVALKGGKVVAWDHQSINKWGIRGLLRNSFISWLGWMEQTSENTHDVVVGVYATGRPGGGRRYPYSTDPTVNPLRFSDLNFVSEVHQIGEIWANMLHNVYAVLVESHGFSDAAKTDARSRKGNVMFMHLFIDALSLQPCEPTFIKARDAIIQADRNRYNGVNKCLLWKAFASRELGTNAKESNEGFRDGDDVPQDCERDD